MDRDPGRAASGHSATVSNLETSSQLAQENDPVRGSLEFLTTTANRMDSPRPSDFAIKSAGSLSWALIPIRWARSQPQSARASRRRMNRASASLALFAEQLLDRFEDAVLAGLGVGCGR